jgi:hypothetical protein
MPSCRAATIKNPDDLLRDNPTAIIMGRRDAGILILIVAVFSSRSPRYSRATRKVGDVVRGTQRLEFVDIHDQCIGHYRQRLAIGPDNFGAQHPPQGDKGLAQALPRLLRTAFRPQHIRGKFAG